MGGSRAGAGPFTRTKLTSVIEQAKNARQTMPTHRAECVDEAAQRGAADHRGLVGGGPGRDRTRDHAGRAPSDGASACAVGISNARAQPIMNTAANRSSRLSMPMKHRRGDHHGRQGIDALRSAHDQTAVVAVSRMPDQQREHDRRHELDQPDQAEIEGAVGQFVDLPADGERPASGSPWSKQAAPARTAQMAVAACRPDDDWAEIIHFVMLFIALRLRFCRPSAVKLLGASQRSKFALRAGHSLSSIEKPCRIAVAALGNHMLAEDAFKGEAVAQRGAARGGIERIAFPLVAPVARASRRHSMPKDIAPRCRAACVAGPANRRCGRPR